MTIITDSRPINKGIEIDLSGPDGNARNLLAMAAHLAEKLGLDGDAITDDMMAEDFDYMVRTFDRHFGSIVTIYAEAV